MRRPAPAPTPARPARALPPDSLLERLQPTQERAFSLMGERLRFESNDGRLVSLAAELFSRYGPPPAAPGGGAGEPLVLRVLLDATAAPAPLFPRPVFRTQGHLFTLALGPHDSGAADVLAGYAFAIVSPALLEEPWRLQHQVLAPLALGPLGPARGYVALHSACLTRGGRAVLVQGPSGAGKSTLAYAAARRGYRVVSEDAVHIGGADTRVWGLPWQFQLLPDAPRFFPELAGLEPRLQPNGKLKIELDLERLHPGSVAASAPLAPLLLLTRRPGPAVIERLPAEAALVEPAWPWQVGWSAAHEALLEQVARRGVYRFATGAEPDAMVDALDEFLEGEWEG